MGLSSRARRDRTICEGDKCKPGIHTADDSTEATATSTSRSSGIATAQTTSMFGSAQGMPKTASIDLIELSDNDKEPNYSSGPFTRGSDRRSGAERL